MNAGFHNVHDIDFLDSKGVWKAEADDITGEDYELHVDATSGRIVHLEDDWLIAFCSDFRVHSA
jgi:hypothetical protein